MTDKKDRIGMSWIWNAWEVVTVKFLGSTAGHNFSLFLTSVTEVLYSLNLF